MRNSRFYRRGIRIRATKVTLNGKTFDSKREAHRYGELELLRLSGGIRRLKVHPRYPIIIKGVPVLMRSERYPNGRQMVYVADFEYLDISTGETVIEDVKGHRTEVYKIKKALMEAMGFEIVEI